ncbi:MAG TPA: transglutaminase family protein [Candidatus Sulfotelmatobacter sp.]|nr:transglutaminase family protein [Candidatus Sulfotelmatobacter sp.]
MIYSVVHTTTFTYQPAVRESVMEVRLQPRSDGPQHCLTFELEVSPAANIMQYRDFMGNTVHHFDIAGKHSQIKITARSSVEVHPVAPPSSADAGSWDDLDLVISTPAMKDDYWEMLLPSQFAKASLHLEALAAEIRCERRDTPLQLLTELNQSIYESFAYVPNSTSVDSPIDDALISRQGVCQDFAHIMIALVRPLRIPCRYVSGYMFHRDEAEEKKDRSLEGASHAWIEAFLPNLGWTAFDPTNNLIGADRHIRVAIGRDYADVPPTRGVHKGEAHSALSVSVTVSPSDAPPPIQLPPTLVIQSRPVNVRSPRIEHEQQQQQ